MTEKTQKTRSHTWLILSLLLAVALIVVGFVFSRILEKSSDIVETNPVVIDAEFYNEDGQKKITTDDLNSAIDQKKSLFANSKRKTRSHSTTSLRTILKVPSSKTPLNTFQPLPSLKKVRSKTISASILTKIFSTTNQLKVSQSGSTLTSKKANLL